MRLKIDLYILSLLVLFALLFLNKVTFPVCWKSDCEFIGFWKLLSTNWIPTVCLIGIIYGFYALWEFNWRILKSSTQTPWRIIEIENISFENLSFLATFIIPLLCFDLDFNLDEGRNAFMLIMVLGAIGAIYIKANLYYTNPSLALLNFKIYRITYQIEGKSRKCIALAKEDLEVKDEVFAKYIDNDIYFIKKARKK